MVMVVVKITKLQEGTTKEKITLLMGDGGGSLAGARVCWVLWFIGGRC